jgi:ABC-type dipeptide/oligopeptide/nickel transport system permease subunit
MLYEGRDFMREAPWVVTFPGLAIMLAVLGFNLLGDGLRDVIDRR